jgi:mono/diheme cytochrome c family protein
MNNCKCNWKKINFLLLAILVIIVGASFCLQTDYSTRNYNIFTEMADSVAYESFSDNPNFEDGKTQRPPVEGTIPRGYLPEKIQDGKLGYQTAGQQLQSPFNPEHKEHSKVIDRGEIVYQNMCSSCHGVTGLGDGKVVKKGFPAPPSLFDGKVVNLKDGHMYHAITFGKGNMSSQALQVERQDRWKVIAFIRDLQRRDKRKKEKAKLEAQKKKQAKPITEGAPVKEEVNTEKKEENKTQETGKEGA